MVVLFIFILYIKCIHFYSRSLLVIYFKYNTVHMASQTPNQSLPLFIFIFKFPLPIIVSFQNNICYFGGSCLKCLTQCSWSGSTSFHSYPMKMKIVWNSKKRFGTPEPKVLILLLNTELFVLGFLHLFLSLCLCFFSYNTKRVNHSFKVLYLND